jgi:anti-sigma regulatory factor (Ser/Thr protein kinase)
VATSKFNLAANASSCSEARRHILNVLDRAPKEVRDAAALLTSELVSNALLHAAGPLTLTIRQEEGRLVRVEVADAGTLPPAVKPYGHESETGRGLKMLDALAEAWGWRPADSGKIVWFELSEDGLTTGAVRGMRRPSDAAVTDPYPTGVPITLLHAPVQAMIRTGACYDAMYRELRRSAGGDGSTAREPPIRLLRLLKEISTQFRGFGRVAEDVWERAVDDGLRHVDITFRLPPEAGAIVERYGRLLDDAEEYCHRWWPRVVPSAEADAVRRWAFGEIASQCRGGRPRPWSEQS